MKKALILLLSALLLITSLAGCGAAEEQEPEAEAAEYDWDAAYAKFSPDTVVMSINGSEVHWDEYFYWMYREYASYAAGYDLSDGVPGYEDTLIGEYIAAAAADFCLQNHIAEQLAGGLGITLTEEDEAVLAERLASDIETNLGEGATEEEFFDYLETVYVSRELYDYVNRTAALYARVFMELYGSSGEKVSDEDALAFAEEYGFITAKHILLRTTDDSGAALSEGERESKLSEANDILAELRAVPEAGPRGALHRAHERAQRGPRPRALPGRLLLRARHRRGGVPDGRGGARDWRHKRCRRELERLPYNHARARHAGRQGAARHQRGLYPALRLRRHRLQRELHRRDGRGRGCLRGGV